MFAYATKGCCGLFTGLHFKSLGQSVSAGKIENNGANHDCWFDHICILFQQSQGKRSSEPLKTTYFANQQTSGWAALLINVQSSLSITPHCGHKTLLSSQLLDHNKKRESVWTIKSIHILIETLGACDWRWAHRSACCSVRQSYWYSSLLSPSSQQCAQVR